MAVEWLSVISPEMFYGVYRICLPQGAFNREPITDNQHPLKKENNYEC